MLANKRILVSWYTDPRYIPPFQLSDRQVVVGPKMAADQPQMMFAGRTPTGSYDLMEALESQRIATQYDAIVVWTDATGTNLPTNLDAFDCPKVLCVGDTHHRESPLRSVLGYASGNRFDFIVLSYSRHHLHWFQQAGLSNLAWIPGLPVRHIEHPAPASKIPGVAFVGNMQKYHPRRLRLIETLHAEQIPLLAISNTREISAEIFASSLVSFNASLNGDLNMRVFEILSAGGCLLTDRLAPQSGLDLCLKEGTEFLGYDNAEEMVAQARFLLDHHDIADRIARNGHSAFLDRMQPKRRANDLMTWVFKGRLNDLYRPGGDARLNRTEKTVPLQKRLEIYEALQELHRQLERPRFLFWSDVPEIFISDASDLTRADLSVVDAGGGVARTPDAPDIDGRPHGTKVDAGQILRSEWDCVVARANAAIPDGVRRTRLLTV